MNYRELTKKLKNLRCKEIPRRSGDSHRRGFNPTTEKGTTIRVGWPG